MAGYHLFAGHGNFMLYHLWNDGAWRIPYRFTIFRNNTWTRSLSICKRQTIQITAHLSYTVTQMRFLFLRN